MAYWLLLPVSIILFLLVEIRIRKPDELALKEANGQITLRKGSFYPRHFTLIIPSFVFSDTLDIRAEAKGKLKVIIVLSLSVSADAKALDALIRAGGWKQDAVKRAAQELKPRVLGMVQTFCEKHDIDDLSPESLNIYLEEHLAAFSTRLGLEMVGISVQSLEPEDASIADAIRQRESARILEQTEAANQNARLSSRKATLDADEKIALYEHELELKKLELLKIRENEEAHLAEKRLNDEIAGKKLRLAVENEELDMLTAHPELLLLSPQAVRLADASRNLKNAKTVVSLSGKDLTEESGISGLFSDTIKQFTEKLQSRQKKND